MVDQLPYEHGEWLVATVNIADREGRTTEDFGAVRIRAMEGRAVAIEITGDLSGTTVVAVLDEGRGRRSRVHLQTRSVCAAIDAAAGVDGLPVPVSGPLAPDSGEDRG
ncbi:MAG TPA: hypothetical protein VGP36_14080 [Mycobacteriales bacterium]|nr:hypothetical protein [Mycobacteriales bacterium]